MSSSGGEQEQVDTAGEAVGSTVPSHAIHEDDKEPLHVREVAAFIAAEIERDRSLFFYRP